MGLVVFVDGNFLMGLPLRLIYVSSVISRTLIRFHFHFYIFNFFVVVAPFCLNDSNAQLFQL